MIYQYLINYAEKNSELVVLAINAFLMDCKSPNGKVRGLALRSLCSLRSKDSVDWTNSAILEGLDDIDPYVKKTAIIGWIKVFRANKNDDFTKKLYKLIFDPSPLVAINAICALNEVEEKKGGWEPTEEIVITLLNRIKDFNEWGQSTILDLVARFKADNEDLKYDIMNLLEDRLKHASSSVLLGAVKVFINLTKDDKTLSKDVQERLASPLITIMASAGTTENYEICYNVISHIKFICFRGGNEFFKYDFKQFFLKYEEPSYIKFLKLDVLALIASEENVQEIITELEEYVSDASAEIAKRAIRAFGDIVIRLNNFNENVSIIKNFLSLKTDYITSEWILALKNIFRKYREAVEEFEDFLINVTFDSISEIEAKAAYIWILGEFGNEIELAPYILEIMIEAHKDLDSVEISIELLTSLTKLFFTRAPEVKGMLGRFFKYAITENNDADLKDRASFYYKLLKSDVFNARQIVCGDGPEAENFTGSNLNLKHSTHDDYFKEEVLKLKLNKIKKGETPKEVNEDVVTEGKVDEKEENNQEEDNQEQDDNLIDFGDEVPKSQPKPEVEYPENFMPSANLLENDEDPFGNLMEEDNKKPENGEDDLIGITTEEKKEEKADIVDLVDVFADTPAEKTAPLSEPPKPALNLK